MSPICLCKLYMSYASNFVDLFLKVSLLSIVLSKLLKLGHVVFCCKEQLANVYAAPRTHVVVAGLWGTI